jgi:hypothetical protein
MYAATYRFMTWMMILATTIAVGCRGAQKFGRQVQVSESSDVELAELGSPQQRLATSLRSEGEGKQSGSTDLSGARNLEVKSASLKKQLDALDPKSSVATTDTAEELGSKVAQPASLTAEVPAASPPNGTTGVNVQSPESMQLRDAAAVMEKINNLPTAERERLRRQLASELIAADQTTQPNPIDLASGAMGRLPTLPPSRDALPEVTPSRIGGGLEQEQTDSDGAVVASLQDVQPTPLTEQEKDAVAQKLLQNYPTTENRKNPVRTAVRPVSATQNQAAHSRIVQAFSPELLSELSEDVLYDALFRQCE